MTPVLVHARACLQGAVRHPVALLLAVAAPIGLVPMMAVAGTLPTPLLLVTAGVTGALAELLLQAVLVRSERFPRKTDGPAAMPILPLSPRQRAVGEALAAAPILAAGALLSVALQQAAPTLWQAELLAFGGGPAYPTVALALLLLPAVLGASLQAGRGGLPQLLGIALPGVLAAAAWRLGLLAGPAELLALVALLAALALAFGPLPSLRLQWPELGARGPLARAPRSAVEALNGDFRSGLLQAHLKATPMLLVALVPWAIAGGGTELGPAFHVAIGLAAVAFGAAMMPLGRSPFGTRHGPLSPWHTLPLDRHQVARRLYLHAAICLLLLPMAFLAVTVATGRVDSFVVPFIILLGLPLAAPVASALTAVWLGDWRRAVLAAVVGIFLLGLFRLTLGTDSAEILVVLALISVLAGTLPVVSLLRPQRLAPLPL